MKLSPQWVREFVELKADNRQLADDLTRAGIAVESISGEGEGTVFEMDITTNRPDAMNHYGVARECSAIYDLPLKPIEPKLPVASAAKAASRDAPNGTLRLRSGQASKAVPSPVVASPAVAAQLGPSPAVPPT